MKVAANVLVFLVNIISLFNAGPFNDLGNDITTTFLLLSFAAFAADAKGKYLLIAVSLLLSAAFWVHPDKTHFGDITYLLVALSFYVCVPTNYTLLLLIKMAVMVPLRYMNPPLWWLAEIVDVCIILYLFYDIKAIITNNFTSLYPDD